jgi:hypothetical protein
VVTPETLCLLSLATRNPAERKQNTTAKYKRSSKKKIRGTHTASAEDTADKVIESMVEVLIDLLNVIEHNQKEISPSWMKLLS